MLLKFNYGFLAVRLTRLCYDCCRSRRSWRVAFRQREQEQDKLSIVLEISSLSVLSFVETGGHSASTRYSGFTCFDRTDML
jgi:hypothetical protein